FFQAEDGIRDRNVTGVQTCALPISSSKMASRALHLFTTDGRIFRIEERIARLSPLFREMLEDGDEDFGDTEPLPIPFEGHALARSEERRVGNEGTARGSTAPDKQQR